MPRTNKSPTIGRVKRKIYLLDQVINETEQGLKSLTDAASVETLRSRTLAMGHVTEEVFDERLQEMIEQQTSKLNTLCAQRDQLRIDLKNVPIYTGWTNVAR